MTNLSILILDDAMCKAGRCGLLGLSDHVVAECVLICVFGRGDLVPHRTIEMCITGMLLGQVKTTRNRLMGGVLYKETDGGSG